MPRQIILPRRGKRPAQARAWTVLLGGLALSSTCWSCGAGSGPLASSLGGSVAGSQGRVRIVFINNTPHRAAFTFGTYNPTDHDGQPDFRQFVTDDNGVMLEGNGVSDILTLTCARAFSIGGPRLLERIERNLPNATRSDTAFIPGVAFHDTNADVPANAGNGSLEPIGTAPPFEAVLGVDYPCEALLVVRFEFDDLNPGAFRTDFEIIPTSSTR